MPYAVNNGVRLHWDETGEGTPVLLVMGHRYSSKMWYPVIPVLSQKHRVIWFDNRGTGESDAPRDATIRDLADDAVAVLDAAGVENAHCYGVSMGGVTVQELGLTYPDRVRSMILGCTGVLTSEVPRAPRIFYALYYVPTWLLAGRAKRGYGSAATPEAIERDLAMLKKDKFVPRGVMAQAKALRLYSTTREAVAAIGKPALVLHGTADQLVRYDLGRELAETLSARLVTIENAGHNYFVAGAQQANDEVTAFLDSVDGS